MEDQNTSLLHYNDCAADSGSPCTCEPPLMTVEDVAGLLFACHEIEYIDAETGYACGCDEDGLLELLTLEAAHKHQADAILAVLRPLIAEEALRETAKYLHEHRRDGDGAYDLWQMYEAGGPEWLSSRAAAARHPLSRPTSEEH
jgi:hypothetical protein